MPVKIFTSKISDGSMKSNIDNFIDTLENREIFLRKCSIKPENTTKLSVSFDQDSYIRYKTINSTAKGDGILYQQQIICDALVVTEPNHAIFLPLADCVGAVIYDQHKKILMVSHLGRHSLEQNGGAKSVEFLINNHNINPKDLQVWLSPAAGGKNYPLYAFNNQSLHQVAVSQLLSAGVLLENIDLSTIDTTEDLQYFSHSQYILGKRPTDGRFAIAAVMTD